MLDEYAQKDYSVVKKLIFIAAIVVVLIIIIVLISTSVHKKNNCKGIYNDLEEQTSKYLKEKDLFPTIEGDKVFVNIKDLPNQVKLKDNVCDGSVKCTKVKDKFIYTYDIKNCKYCTTKDSKWSSFKSEFPKNKKNVDVVATYNYTRVSNYNSKWSKWIPFEDISKKETNGVKLPANKTALPVIPEAAEIVKIIKEDKETYSYRDKEWKWYKNKDAAYSDFSSTQPSGYLQKDLQTEIRTTPTAWSANYPEILPYRVISSKTGYRWYIEKNGTRSYWQNGEYLPDCPQEGYKKDKTKKARMYSYYDKKWRWYKNEKRYYSTYSSVPKNDYIYRDDALFKYSNWSPYKDQSNLDSSNTYYREEKTKTYSKYMIQYIIKSDKVFNEYLSKEDFEKKTGTTLERLLNDRDYKILVKYKYRYY